MLVAFDGLHIIPVPDPNLNISAQQPLPACHPSPQSSFQGQTTLMHKAICPQGSVLQPDLTAPTRRPPTTQSAGSSTVSRVPEWQSPAWRCTTTQVTQSRLGECDAAVPPPPERHALSVLMWSHIPTQIGISYVRGDGLYGHHNLNQAVTTMIRTLLVTRRRTQPILLRFPIRMLPIVLVF